jgi:hypothetical protein
MNRSFGSTIGARPQITRELFGAQDGPRRFFKFH